MTRTDAEWLALNSDVIEQFRTSGGALTGAFADNPTLLLTTLGARSKQERVSPLTFSRFGEHYVIAASKAGASTHPAWFHNLCAHPIVKVELGDLTFMTTSQVADEPARTELWAAHVERFPRFAAYADATSRVIPMVVLPAVSNVPPPTDR